MGLEHSHMEVGPQNQLQRSHHGTPQPLAWYYLQMLEMTDLESKPATSALSLPGVILPLQVLKQAPKYSSDYEGCS